MVVVINFLEIEQSYTVHINNLGGFEGKTWQFTI